MAMYSFVPLFVRWNFAVCRHVSDKLGCAAGEKKIAEHCFKATEGLHSPLPRGSKYPVQRR
jgi:hypothetical protein